MAKPTASPSALAASGRPRWRTAVCSSEGPRECVARAWSMSFVVGWVSGGHVRYGVGVGCDRCRWCGVAVVGGRVGVGVRLSVLVSCLHDSVRLWGCWAVSSGAGSGVGLSCCRGGVPRPVRGGALLFLCCFVVELLVIPFRLVRFSRFPPARVGRRALGGAVAGLTLVLFGVGVGCAYGGVSVLWV
ncbi:hypothetical protein Tco_0151304 [Tanacetum coccineum]